jgi:hypothetical protein
VLTRLMMQLAGFAVPTYAKTEISSVVLSNQAINSQRGPCPPWRSADRVDHAAELGAVPTLVASDSAMKVFAAIITLALTGALLPTVAAAEFPTTKADCEQAGMRWMKKNGECLRPNLLIVIPEQARLVLGLIGMGSEMTALFLLWLVFLGRPKPTIERVLDSG